MIEILVGFVQTPGLLLRVGWMMAAAVILGYLLYCDYRDIWKWAVSLGVYIAFQEWLRYTIAQTNGAMVPPSLLIAAVGGVIFMTGLLIGATIGRTRTTTCVDAKLTSKEIDELLIT